MIEKMKMVGIIGKASAMEPAIDACLDCASFEPEPTGDFLQDQQGFAHETEENPYKADYMKLLEAVTTFNLTPKSAEIPPELSPEETEKIMSDVLPRLFTLQNQRTVLLREAHGLSTSVHLLEHFQSFPVPLEELYHAKLVSVRFGKLPLTSLPKLSALSLPNMLYTACSTDTEAQWGIYLTTPEASAETDKAMSGIYFEQVRLPETVGTETAAAAAARLGAQRDLKMSGVKTADEEIAKTLEAEEERCVSVYFRVKRDYDRFEMRRYCAIYHDSFVLMGWVPEAERADIQKNLDTVDAIEYKIDTPERVRAESARMKKLSPPTKLKNCALFRPYEFYIGLYGLPDYHEMDPTAFVAITYTIFYGIMFADVGQGILLALFGYLMYRFRKWAVGLILVPCGIAGAIGGLVFGSIFGFTSALDPLYHAVGMAGKPVTAMDSMMTILILSVAMGMVLIVIAMLFNTVTSFRRHRYGQAIFSKNGICGLLIYAAIIMAALSVGLSVKIPWIPVLIICVFLPIVGIILSEPLTGLIERDPHWKPESWGEYLLQAFFEMFETAISYASNSISFLRVGAFVFVHEGLMMAVFSIAGQPGTTAYYITVVVGNAIVLGMEGFLVAIQALRLEFYEMFSRFYDGEGKEFKPIRLAS